MGLFSDQSSWFYFAWGTNIVEQIQNKVTAGIEPASREAVYKSSISIEGEFETIVCAVRHEEHSVLRSHLKDVTGLGTGLLCRTIK